MEQGRKVDVRLPGKGNSNSHGARPVHLIITIIKWIQTSRLSITTSHSLTGGWRPPALAPRLLLCWGAVGGGGWGVLSLLSFLLNSLSGGAGGRTGAPEPGKP